MASAALFMNLFQLAANNSTNLMNSHIILSFLSSIIIGVHIFRNISMSAAFFMNLFLLAASKLIDYMNYRIILDIKYCYGLIE